MYAYFYEIVFHKCKSGLFWTRQAKNRNPGITMRLRCSEVDKAMWRRQHQASYLVDEYVVDVAGIARRH